MVSKIITDYLRDLAERIKDADGASLDMADVLQVIDIADTLDEDREASSQGTKP